MVKEGTYEVVIDRDYLETPEEFKYAVNSFVKNQGETSYDVEKHGPNDFYVYTPGSQAVEDLPKVRHFHTGRTAGLTLTMVGVPFWILLLVLVL
jgi:hypothetical protein